MPDGPMKKIHYLGDLLRLKDKDRDDSDVEDEKCEKKPKERLKGELAWCKTPKLTKPEKHI